MAGLGTRSAIERAESGNSQPKAARASALPDAAKPGEFRDDEDIVLVHALNENTEFAVRELLRA